MAVPDEGVGIARANEDFARNIAIEHYRESSIKNPGMSLEENKNKLIATMLAYQQQIATGNPIVIDTLSNHIIANPGTLESRENQLLLNQFFVSMSDADITILYQDYQKKISLSEGASIIGNVGTVLGLAGLAGASLIGGPPAAAGVYTAAQGIGTILGLIGLGITSAAWMEKSIVNSDFDLILHAAIVKAKADPNFYQLFEEVSKKAKLGITLNNIIDPSLRSNLFSTLPPDIMELLDFLEQLHKSGKTLDAKDLTEHVLNKIKKIDPNQTAVKKDVASNKIIVDMKKALEYQQLAMTLTRLSAIIISDYFKKPDVAATFLNLTTEIIKVSFSVVLCYAKLISPIELTSTLINSLCNILSGGPKKTTELCYLEYILDIVMDVQKDVKQVLWLQQKTLLMLTQIVDQSSKNHAELLTVLGKIKTDLIASINDISRQNHQLKLSKKMKLLNNFLEIIGDSVKKSYRLEFSNYITQLVHHATEVSKSEVFCGVKPGVLGVTALSQIIYQQGRLDLIFGLLPQLLTYMQSQGALEKVQIDLPATLIWPVSLPNPLEWARAVVYFSQALVVKPQLAGTSFNHYIDDINYLAEEILQVMRYLAYPKLIGAARTIYLRATARVTEQIVNKLTDHIFSETYNRLSALFPSLTPQHVRLGVDIPVRHYKWKLDAPHSHRMRNRVMIINHMVKEAKPHLFYYADPGIGYYDIYQVDNSVSVFELAIQLGVFVQNIVSTYKNDIFPYKENAQWHEGIPGKTSYKVVMNHSSQPIELRFQHINLVIEGMILSTNRKGSYYKLYVFPEWRVKVSNFIKQNDNFFPDIDLTAIKFIEFVCLCVDNQIKSHMTNLFKLNDTSALNILLKNAITTLVEKEAVDNRASCLLIFTQINYLLQRYYPCAESLVLYPLSELYDVNIMSQIISTDLSMPWWRFADGIKLKVNMLDVRKAMTPTVYSQSVNNQLRASLEHYFNRSASAVTSNIANISDDVSWALVDYVMHHLKLADSRPVKAIATTKPIEVDVTDNNTSKNDSVHQDLDEDFDNTGDASNVYIPTSPSGAVSTLGDGNCLFNSLALGLTDLIFQNSHRWVGILENIITTYHIPIPSQPIWQLRNQPQAFEAALRGLNSVEQQQCLAAVLRQIAWTYINQAYDIIFREQFHARLRHIYAEYRNDTDFKDDDFILYHEYIRTKLAEFGLTEENFILWWETTGKLRYINAMFSPATHAGEQKKWGGELELYAIALLFRINVAWTYRDAQSTIGVQSGMIESHYFHIAETTLLRELGIVELSQILDGASVINMLKFSKNHEELITIFQELDDHFLMMFNGILKKIILRPQDPIVSVLSIPEYAWLQINRQTLESRGIINEHGRFICEDIANTIIAQERIALRLRGISPALANKIRTQLPLQITQFSVGFTGDHWFYIADPALTKDEEETSEKTHTQAPDSDKQVDETDIATVNTLDLTNDRYPKEGLLLSRLMQILHQYPNMTQLRYYQAEANPRPMQLSTQFMAGLPHSSTHCNPVIKALLALPSDRLAICANGQIRVWELNTNKLVLTMTDPHHSAALLYLQDTRLVSGGHGGAIQLWNLTTGQCMQLLQGHTHVVNTLALLDKDHFASGSQDTTIRIWQITSGLCLFRISAIAGVGPTTTMRGMPPRTTGLGNITSLLNSAPGRILCQGQYYWDINAQPAEHVAPGAAPRMRDSKVLRLTTTTSWPEGVRNNAILVNDSLVYKRSHPSQIILININTGVVTQTLADSHFPVDNFALSPEGRYLAAASAVGVRVWDLQQNVYWEQRGLKITPGYRAPYEQTPPMQLSFLVDNRLVVGTEDGQLHVFLPINTTLTESLLNLSMRIVLREALLNRQLTIQASKSPDIGIGIKGEAKHVLACHQLLTSLVEQQFINIDLYTRDH